jgi:hypothetical protein
MMTLLKKLQDVAVLTLLGVWIMLIVAYCRNKKSASDFKFKTNQVTEITAKWTDPRKFLGKYISSKLSGEKASINKVFSVNVNLESLVEDGKCEIIEISKVFDSLKLDLKEFTLKNKLKHALFYVSVKCNSIYFKEISGVPDIVFYSTEISDEGVFAINVFIKDPLGRYLPPKDHPSSLLKSIFGYYK